MFSTMDFSYKYTPKRIKKCTNTSSHSSHKAQNIFQHPYAFEYIACRKPIAWPKHDPTIRFYNQQQLLQLVPWHSSNRSLRVRTLQPSINTELRSTFFDVSSSNKPTQQIQQQQQRPRRWWWWREAPSKMMEDVVYSANGGVEGALWRVGCGPERSLRGYGRGRGCDNTAKPPTTYGYVSHTKQKHYNHHNTPVYR